MESIWDGITRAETLDPEAAETRNALADAGKRYDWIRVFAILSMHPGLVNSTRPDGSSRYAPLHQVAHGGASTEIAQRMLVRGAWRSLRNARGERPVDVAERRGHRHLLPGLAPEFRHRVPVDALLQIQRHFHEVIRGRVAAEVSEHRLRLPELEPLIEMSEPRMWFPVPGMYGGFSFSLDLTADTPRLVSESWCRVVEGSGQRHEVTVDGSRLVAEGFV